MRVLHVVFCAVVVLLAAPGNAPVGSAQLRLGPDNLCEAFDSNADVVLARVTAHDSIEELVPYTGDDVRPPARVRVDAVRAIVLESFHGDLRDEVLISPPGASYSGPQPSFDPPLEIGQQYLFVGLGSNGRMTGSARPASDANVSEARRRSQATTTSISGRLGVMPLFGPGLTTFLGRVVSGGDFWGLYQAQFQFQPYRVVAVESLMGTPPSGFPGIPVFVPEIASVAPPAFGETFSAGHALQVGETYLFVIFDRPRVERIMDLSDRGTESTVQTFSAFAAVHALHHSIVPLEAIRQLAHSNRPGPEAPVVIAMADLGFQTRTVSTSHSGSFLKYQFDDLPTDRGPFTFAVEVNWGGCLHDWNR